jgi:hypothetical protein
LKNEPAPQKEPYFRFNIEFDGPEPSLDDVSKMQELKESVRRAIAGSTELDRLARRMIAELFVFELDSTPIKENGQFMCAGHVICRLRANSDALGVLLTQLTRSLAKFILQDRSIGGSFLDGDGNFRRRLIFEVPDRSSPISIQLQEGQSQPCSISGSPFTIRGLVVVQELDACFGRADHVKRKRVDSTDMLSRKRTRL